MLCMLKVAYTVYRGKPRTIKRVVVTTQKTVCESKRDGRGSLAVKQASLAAAYAVRTPKPVVVDTKVKKDVAEKEE